MRIIIFSRPIRTGKTMELAEWCKSQNNVAGILMPDVDGVRMMKDLRSGELWQAECFTDAPVEEITTVGKFCFYQKAFDKANLVIKDALNHKPGWLVIDEVGKLELGRKGFYPSVHHLLQQPALNLLIVVRDTLVGQVLSFFDIQTYTVVNSL